MHTLLREGGLPGGGHDLGDPGWGVTLTWVTLARR